MIAAHIIQRPIDEYPWVRYEQTPAEEPMTAAVEGQPDPPRLLTPTELVEMLNLTGVPTLNRWRRLGEGPPFIRVGTGTKSVRYRLSDVEAWLEGRVHSPACPACGYQRP